MRRRASTGIVRERDHPDRPSSRAATGRAHDQGGSWRSRQGLADPDGKARSGRRRKGRRLPGAPQERSPQGSVQMMTTIGEGGSRQELTNELAALDRQLRELSQQWEDVERTISEKTRRRRELIARQEETNEDHEEEINRLQSDVYALRDRLDQLRDSHLDFSALYRILQQARA